MAAIKVERVFFIEQSQDDRWGEHTAASFYSQKLLGTTHEPHIQHTIKRE